jgi:hypothetical protein
MVYRLKIASFFSSRIMLKEYVSNFFTGAAAGKQIRIGFFACQSLLLSPSFYGAHIYRIRLMTSETTVMYNFAGGNRT